MKIGVEKEVVDVTVQFVFSTNVLIADAYPTGQPHLRKKCVIDYL